MVKKYTKGFEMVPTPSGILVPKNVMNFYGDKDNQPDAKQDYNWPTNAPPKQALERYMVARHGWMGCQEWYNWKGIRQEETPENRDQKKPGCFF